MSELKASLNEARIEAEPLVVDRMEIDSILETSRDASVVFLPFEIRRGRTVGPGGVPLTECSAGLPVVAFVLASQDIDLDAEPEEGPHAEIAEAMDRTERASRVAREAVKKAEEAEKSVEEIRTRLAHVSADPSDSGERERLEREVAQAVEHARQARAAAERTLAEAEQARRDAEGAGSEEQTDPTGS